MGTAEHAAVVAGGDLKGIDTFQPDGYVSGLQEIEATQVAVVGGKAAHLGELSRIEGIRVPPGFCVTTDAFRRIIGEAPSIDDRLDRLSRLNADDREAIRTLSAEIRRTLEGIVVPDDVTAAITRALARLGEQAAYAVRSSATAEDLPTASFAGQQDTYLNVVGPAAILQHISRCWASLFTERAVTYRLRNGFDHRRVHMAVVVQQMVFPHAAGILFTADPVTSNRKVASVEASFGLGEALVSGLVNADAYKVRDGEVVAKAVGSKRLAIHALPAGGTEEQAIDPAQQEQPALTDAQVVRLAQLGRRIEAHFGRPQDIEWCLVGDGFEIVQSRPITTLFPIPDAGDRENHVYVSVGHQQMMTDPMKPLGLSVWQLKARPRMYEAGGRLFVDVTQILASPATRSRHPRPGEVRSADRGRAADHPRTRRLHPDAPGRGSRGRAASRRAVPDRDRSGHRHRADRAQPGFHRRLGTRHPVEVRTGAARLHPGGHPGAQADPVRSAKPSGVHGSDGCLGVAQREAAGVAGREERGRHAHAVRPPQRHVGDGSGAPGRRGRDPPASGGGGVSARRRGRGFPGRAGRACRRAGSAGRHRGVPRQVRHALRRRDRHHEAALERTPDHARAPDPRQRQELRAGRRRAALRAGAAGGAGRRSRSCWSACGPSRTGSGRPKRPSGRSTGSGPSSGTGSIRSTSSSAAPSCTSRPCWKRPSASCRPACFVRRRTSSTSRSRSSTTSCARTRWMTSSSPSARTRSGRIRRSHRPGCSRRRARSSPGRTDATTCRPAR